MSLIIQADELTKTSWRIIAVELHHAMPRRKPELPHLYVGLTKVSLDERLADLKAGAGPKELAGMHK